MFQLFRLMRRMLNYIKTMRKYKKFKKYCQLGEGLELNSNADCVVDKPGMIKIGNHCRIHAHLISQDDGTITMGHHCHISYKTVIGAVNSITLGNCVGISNHVHMYDNNNHPTSPSVRRQMFIDGFDGDAWRWKHAESKPIVIEDNVWIGEYSAVLKGVTIGEGSIVASHSVVTKDVPPYSVVAGNPARVVKKLEHDE